MAKVKAPLFSLEARGAIGGALVFFPWKGLNAVRKYVIPSNPKTTAQNTQRGYLKLAVTDIHAAQAHATQPMLAKDITAYSLLGSCEPTPRTWFNTICKQWMDLLRKTLSPTVYRDCVLTPGNDQLDIYLRSDEITSGAITAGSFYYGTSKTALFNSIVAVVSAGAQKASATITALADKTKYYIQFKPTAPDGYVGANSGIYHETTT